MTLADERETDVGRGTHRPLTSAGVSGARNSLAEKAVVFPLVGRTFQALLLHLLGLLGFVFKEVR